MKFNLYVKDLGKSLDKLTSLHGGYTSHFVGKTRSVVKQSFQYIQGKLLEKGNGNMCRYANISMNNILFLFKTYYFLQLFSVKLL